MTRLNLKVALGCAILMFVYSLYYIMSGLGTLYSSFEKSDFGDIHYLNQRLGLDDVCWSDAIRYPSKCPPSSRHDTGCRQNLRQNVYQEVVPDSVYVYSAFYDDREEMHYIRFVSIVRKETQSKLWCRFIGIDKDAYVLSPIQYYEFSDNHNFIYGGWMLSCRVPGAMNTSGLCFVVLSTRSDHGHHNNDVTIPVFETRPTGERYIVKNFALCSPPIFGAVDTIKLIEFIELSRILGADKIIMYIFTEDNKTLDVLEYYQKRGDIVTLPWRLPLTKRAIWYHGQAVAINDCLYRTMSHFRFTVINDLDEYLIPYRTFSTWSELIKAIQMQKYCGYSFESAYFQQSSPNKLASLNTNRSQHYSEFKKKVMVEPRKVFEMGIHHVSRPWPDSQNYVIRHVDPNIAYIHHYRNCVPEIHRPCINFTSDYTVPKNYGKTLLKNVQFAVKKILKKQSISVKSVKESQRINKENIKILTNK